MQVQFSSPRISASVGPSSHTDTVSSSLVESSRLAAASPPDQIPPPTGEPTGAGPPRGEI